MSLQVVAQHLAAKGRGPDDTLVHMSRDEVKSLSDLAMAHGGHLTINPQTGLPEAGFLSAILPAVAGFALNAAVPGLGSAMGGFAIPAIVGGASYLMNPNQGLMGGLMAGLGAYGGAGVTSSLSTAGAETIGSQAAGQSYLASAPGVLEGAGAGLSADMAYNLANAGVTDTVAANAAQQAAASKIGFAGVPQDIYSKYASVVYGIPQANTTPVFTGTQGQTTTGRSKGMGF